MIKRVRAGGRLVAIVLHTLLLTFTWWAVGLYRNRSVHGRVSWRHAITTRWADGLLRIMGCRLDVRGVPPEPPFCLVANHQGYLDILVVIATTKARLVSRADLAAWPGIGWLARTFGTIFIDRSRSRDIPRVAADMRDVLAEGDGIVFFPEGTSSSGAGILPFKASLMSVPAEVGLPVHTAAISYDLPGGDARTDLCWWGDMTFADHLWRLLTFPRFNARIQYGHAPIEPADRKTLSKAAFHSVENLYLQSPTTTAR
ncbi:MAG: 1-acyl-sn-glycerol-3-phosphate acyltransferase [Bacteroidetes bacterium CG12_big_fil_rev_8_21_14_0_65_60_17]|nr:MAG: 1-acyl-sn-glycerol-3-phosphate acyltransferase [Bacteroidetes bacterium CG12_big_fil_rev_8_21_14_0_65_60_17]